MSRLHCDDDQAENKLRLSEKDPQLENDYEEAHDKTD